MFNNDIENNSNRNLPQEEEKMNSMLKTAITLTIILAVLRILSFDIMSLFSDLLSALMIYFYMQSRNKCMAVMTGINGSLGIIYAVIKFFPAWVVAMTKWFSFYYTILLLTTIYAVGVYGFILYLAYLGYKNYEWTGFGIPTPQSGQGNYNVSSNYGAIDNPRNSNFKVFGGKGTTLG
jgi:hypothetical protein